MKLKLQCFSICLFCFILFLFLPNQILSQSESEKLNFLLENYEAAQSDSVKIERLFSIARFYSDYIGDDVRADSISELAIDVAVSSYRTEMMVLAYNMYIESNELQIYYSKSLEYANKAVQFGKNVHNPEIECRSYKNLARVYLAGYEYDQALEYGLRTLSIADGLKNDKLKADSYLVIGEALEGKNQPIEETI